MLVNMHSVYAANLQVGQVILTYPYQMALMGIIPAIIIAIGVGILNFYTLWLLVILYLERKRIMVSMSCYALCPASFE